ncbi:MAG: SpoIIE family protein phosphatase [Ignavibacteria bacterium]|nr:SpoIIE family protein phosphatase [Ignavibacteria bacterium]MBT8382222.1 SpoIIE family protein phosphatase [Ignavibacteria bacterium]MBT8391457.1 SpoIIE family protein phosphatase [Ignavibacteria bacterium]NNJ54120.1 SpoIIE family protein phosphatase [Ignavibacteriaceae bacterium]NNL21387.1 SpoIIE family protein phosphatase [Ignavibacteriaceae bacterium]
MKLLFSDNSVNTHFRLFTIAVILLFTVRLIVGRSDSIFFEILQVVLLVFISLFLLLMLINYQSRNTTVPLSLVMNLGILNAVAFLVITFSDVITSSLLDNVNQMVSDPGLVYNIVSILYVLIFIAYFAYVLIVLRHLFILNQIKNAKIYFNTMVAFFILAALSSQFFTSKSLSFVEDTFLIVSVLLMVFNSVRISWIAFLSKKEKIYLLVLSVVISVLFAVNLGNTSGNGIHSQVLNSFSPSIDNFVTTVMLYGAIYFFVLFFTTLFHLPTAEAYDRKAQEVSSLQYFSKLITEVLDFDDLAQTVTDITLKVSHSNAAWILWKDADQFITLANKNVGFVDSEKTNKIILNKIKFEKINSTKTISLSDESSKDGEQSIFELLSVSPIRSQGLVKGLLIAAKTSGKLFTNDELSAVETFSDYASVAIENAKLLEESIEKERLEKELDVAREIQKKILPDKEPSYSNLQISSVFIPAFEVGGDYYDFFELESEKLGFVIADVSGKGISAAFVMAEVKGIFESLSKTIKRPKDILIGANSILKNTLDSKTFVSAAYGIIDLENEILCISRAGHCPVLLIRNEETKQIKPSGIGLGLIDTDYFEENIEEFEVQLKSNDTIVLYTDGITEAKNDKLEDFGDEYFKNILFDGRHLTAAQLSNKIIKEVTLFSKSYSQYDDITLVIFKFGSRQQKKDGLGKQKNKLDGEKEWQSSTHQF